MRKEETMTGNEPRDEVLDAVVIGGSQAGLAMAWHLTQHLARLITTRAQAAQPAAQRTA